VLADEFERTDVLGQRKSADGGGMEGFRAVSGGAEGQETRRREGGHQEAFR